MKLIDIKQKIINFLGEFIQADNLDNDADLFETGMVNSLFAMQLVLFIEKEFDFQVANEDLNIQNFSSVNAITTMVATKLNVSE